jgi:hypothetical protein
MIPVQITDKVRGFTRGLHLLRFYSHGFRRYLITLLVLCVLLGLMETFQIVLLYPIMNATIDFHGAGIALFEPFYTVIRGFFALPDIVLFSLLFILLVFLTYFVSLTYSLVSFSLTKKIGCVTRSAKISPATKDLSYPS